MTTAAEMLKVLKLLVDVFADSLISIYMVAILLKVVKSFLAEI